MTPIKSLLLFLANRFGDLFIYILSIIKVYIIHLFMNLKIFFINLKIFFTGIFSGIDKFVYKYIIVVISPIIGSFIYSFSQYFYFWLFAIGCNIPLLAIIVMWECYIPYIKLLLIYIIKKFFYVRFKKPLDLYYLEDLFNDLFTLLGKDYDKVKTYVNAMLEENGTVIFLYLYASPCFFITLFMPWSFAYYFTWMPVIKITFVYILLCILPTFNQIIFFCDLIIRIFDYFYSSSSELKDILILFQEDEEDYDNLTDSWYSAPYKGLLL